MKVVLSLISILFTVGLLVGSPGCKKSKESPKAPAEKTVTTSNAQTTCPIEGTKIDKNVFVDYQGKRVYFCCTDCKAKFNAEPAKYIKQMEDKGIVLEKTAK